MLRIKKNLDKIKGIRTINLENTSLTLKSKEYIEYFEEKKIKVLIDLKKLKMPNKIDYQILLGGSTISGKTSYYVRCSSNRFNYGGLTTIGVQYATLNPSFNNNINVKLFDMARWNGRFDSMIPAYLYKADGVLLLFDVSSREDFDNLKYCLNLITNYLELEDFPVLLIANKIDLERAVMVEEIEKFQKDNELIGYFETSCRDGINVKSSFDFLMDYIIKKEKNYNTQ